MSNGGVRSVKELHKNPNNGIVIVMKKGIHPEYRDVAFKDVTSGEIFVIGASIATDKTINYNGKDLPLVEVEISSVSHPFYTGDVKNVENAGRAEKFRSRAAKASK